MCVFTRIFARFDYNYAILCSIFSIIINSIITMLCRKHIYIFFSLSLSHYIRILHCHIHFPYIRRTRSTLHE